MKKFLLSALGLIFIGLSANAEKTAVQTCLFGKDYNSKSVSAYATEWTTTNGGFTWNVVNFNNNQNGWNYVKCGSKNGASVATITTATAIAEEISTVSVSIGAITAASVNSIDLLVSSSNDFTNATSYPVTAAQGDQNVDISTPAANMYYQLKVDCAQGSANGLVQIDKIVYYEGEGDLPGTGETPDPDQPSNPGGDDEDNGNIVQVFTSEIGFPVGAQATVPTEPTEVTATDTKIKYTIYGVNVNPGNYLMVAGKVVSGAYISWTLDYPMSELIMTTASGTSTNGASKVKIFAGENEIGEYAVNGQNQAFKVTIPEAYQAAGTVYKVASSTDQYNQQFAKFEYVKVGNEGNTTEPEGPEAPEGIITVAKALELIGEGYRGNAEVKGIITAITEMSNTDSGSQYGNASYIIKDDAEDEEGLTVFRGYWLNGEKFVTGKEIEVGGTVTVSGTLTLYGSTPEINSGNKVIAYEAPTPEQPGDVIKGVTENFTTGIGFPDASGSTPEEATEYTSTETDITYEIFGCYANNGYLMLFNKNFDNAYISWTLDFPMKQLIMKTTSNCSTNTDNYAQVYADDTLIETVFVGVRNTTLTVNIPTENQVAGTVYKVMASNQDGTGNAGANEQFASFTYVEDVTNAVEGIEAQDGEAVYYNLQGVRVMNPERGIFVKVQNGKASKVVK